MSWNELVREGKFIHRMLRHNVKFDENISNINYDIFVVFYTTQVFDAPIILFITDIKENVLTLRDIPLLDFEELFK